MKVGSATLALVLVTTAVGTADAVEMQGSIEAGVGQAGWSGVGDGFTSRTGFCAGGAFTLAWRGPIGLRIGLLFTRKGARIPADPETITIDYLEVPLLVELGGRRGSRVRPVVLGGIAPAGRVRARSSQFPDEDSASLVEPFDLSAVAGVALEIGGRLAVEVKYDLGLHRVAKRTDDSRNRAWFIGMRWLI